MPNSFRRITCPGLHLTTVVTLAKITLKKTVFTFPKNECNRKAWIAALNQNEGTPVQSQRINVKSTLRKVLF